MNINNLTDNEKSYLADVQEYLAEGGIGEKERKFLNRTRDYLNIPQQRAVELENYCCSKQNTTELTENELSYIEDINYYLSDDGVIDDKERKLLEKTRLQLGISEQRGFELESHCQSKQNTSEFTENELSYIEDINYYLADDGVIDEKERKLLEKSRLQLGISEQRAKELEEYVLPPVEKQLNSTQVQSTKVGKWIVYDNGTDFDTETKLLWCRFAYGQQWQNNTAIGKSQKMSWHSAMKIADNFNKNGGHADCKDWQLQ